MINLWAIPFAALSACCFWMDFVVIPRYPTTGAMDIVFQSMFCLLGGLLIYLGAFFISEMRRLHK